MTMSTQERRRTARVQVMLSASIEHNSQSASTRLSNISDEGARVSGSSLFPNSCVVLHRNGVEVPSQVVWASSGSAGLRFNAPVEGRSILRHVPVGRTLMNPRSRRPGLRCMPLSPAERTAMERWGRPGVERLGD